MATIGADRIDAPGALQEPDHDNIAIANTRFIR